MKGGQDRGDKYNVSLNWLSLQAVLDQLRQILAQAGINSIKAFITFLRDAEDKINSIIGIFIKLRKQDCTTLVIWAAKQRSVSNTNFPSIDRHLSQKDEQNKLLLV